MTAAPLRKSILAFALAGSLVFGLSSAQAASLPIPNSGFETPCNAVPCNWSGTSGSTIEWDTTFHVHGNASLQLNSIGTPGIQAVSSCVSPATGQTTYNLEFWYRTTAALSFVSMFINEFQSTDCTGSPFAPASTASTSSPNTSGNWTRLQGQTTTSAGVQSVKVILGFSCASTCATGLFANFDDVVAQTEPLAVAVSSFVARHVANGVLLRWHTGTEAALLGFRVFRSQGHSWHRVTRSLIAAKGSVSGASYRFLDRTAKRHAAYRYRIQAVNSDGTTHWFGPARPAR
jgi:hypothetical protein